MINLTFKNIWHILFIFFFLSIIPQLFNFADKGQIYDGLWKVFALLFLIISTILYNVVNKLIISKHMVIIVLMYAIYKTALPFLHGNLNDLNFNYIVNIIYPPISLFIFFVFFDNAELERLSIAKLSIFIIIVIFYTVILNMITNFNSIFKILNITNPYQYNFSSIFSNRNTFGFFIYISLIFYTLYVLIYKKLNIFILLIGILLFLNLLLTFSRASIFSSVILLIVFLLMYNYKKYALPFITILILTFILLRIIGLNDFVLEFIIRPEQGLTGREEIYNASLYIIKSNNLFIGAGEIKAHLQLYEMTGKHIFHNTFITIITSEGIVSFFFFILILFYSFKNILIIYKFDKLIGSILFAATISYLGYSLVESLLIFNSSLNSYVITLIIILIPKYYKNYLLKQSFLVIK